MLYGVDAVLPELYNHLDKERLVLFAGSGISVPSGLPTWDGFIDAFLEICKQYNSQLPHEQRFDDIIRDADERRTRDPITTISVLKDKISQVVDSGLTLDYFVSELQADFYSKQYNELHKLIVATDYKHILTSNYDLLLEQAAKAEGYKSLPLRSYSYEQEALIFQALYNKKTAIIHMHGVITGLKLDKMVLTSRDYYNIMNGNYGIRHLIRDIFVNHSVLLIGYGGSDPHLEEIVNEINISLRVMDNPNLELPEYYLVLMEDKADSVVRSYKASQRVNIIGITDYSECNTLLSALMSHRPRPKE